MTFDTRTDGFVRGVTLSILVLLGAVVVAAVRFALAAPADAVRILVLVLTILLVGAIASFAYGFAPRRYRLAEGSLWVDRAFGDLEYSLQGLRDVAPLDLWLGLCWKRLPGGNSGLFGLYGSFSHKELGPFQMHARSATGGVLLRWDGRLLVVAPERRDEFVRSVRARRPSERALP